MAPILVPPAHAGLARPVTGRLLVVLALLLTATGCQPLTRSPAWYWFSGDSPPAVPTKMTPIWTDTVMYQPGLPAMRGFGGRILFFHHDSDRPIRVAGTLTVYAFDGVGPDAEAAVPERKYVFLADRLEEHHSESKLGPSYSFWLPWDDLGGYERQLTLITRFEPSDSTPIMATPTRHYLPGLPLPQPAPATNLAQRPLGARRGYAERPVAYEEEIPESSTGSRMDTVTIDVPPAFVRHAQGEQPEYLPSSRTRALQRLAEAQAATVAAAKGAADVAEPGAGASSEDGGRRGADGAPLHPAGQKKPAEIRRQPYAGQWLRPLPPTPRGD